MRLCVARVKQEARCLYRCRAIGIDVPAIWFLDEDAGRIFMEAVAGVTLKEYIFTHRDAAGGLALAVVAHGLLPPVLS